MESVNGGNHDDEDDAILLKNFVQAEIHRKNIYKSSFLLLFIIIFVGSPAAFPKFFFLEDKEEKVLWEKGEKPSNIKTM